jgi:hypothetical protein
MMGGALVAAVGCGSAEEAEPEARFESQAKCLSCGVEPEQEEQQTPDPAPRMIATPETIAFYPDSLESPELLPKEIVVDNATGHLVYVTHVRVIDTREGLETGGAAFFDVQPLAEPVLLQSGERLSLWVRFLGSTKQSSATLVIVTTAPETPRLDVDLTGKYFIDG